MRRHLHNNINLGQNELASNLLSPLSALTYLCVTLRASLGNTVTVVLRPRCQHKHSLPHRPHSKLPSN